MATKETRMARFSGERQWESRVRRAWEKSAARMEGTGAGSAFVYAAGRYKMASKNALPTAARVGPLRRGIVK